MQNQTIEAELHEHQDKWKETTRQEDYKQRHQIQDKPRN